MELETIHVESYAKLLTNFTLFKLTCHALSKILKVTPGSNKEKFQYKEKPQEKQQRRDLLLKYTWNTESVVLTQEVPEEGQKHGDNE